jgi:hypothetical protein
MKVFISWSGQSSKPFAEAIRNWLPLVLQSAKPYFTPADIEKGAKWDNEISEQLEQSDICIIALTRDNLNSPWIMFEAGAISRRIGKARICPIVFKIEKTDVQGPLSRFQATAFNKVEIRQLLTTINNAANDESRLTESILEKAFEMYWATLKSEVEAILVAPPPPDSGPEIRTENSLLRKTYCSPESCSPSSKSSIRHCWSSSHMQEPLLEGEPLLEALGGCRRLAEAAGLAG